MVENHILVDVTHMSWESIAATLRLLDELDPGATVPLVATHSACQAFSGVKYNLSDNHIAAIAKRGGVVGLIACRHWMSKGMQEPKTFDQTMDVINPATGGFAGVPYTPCTPAETNPAGRCRYDFNASLLTQMRAIDFVFGRLAGMSLR